MHWEYVAKVASLPHNRAFFNPVRVTTMMLRKLPLLLTFVLSFSSLSFAGPLTELNKKEEQTLSSMINYELKSFYFYTALEVYFNNSGLSGMESWAKVQANEELNHFRLHIEYAKSKNVTLVPMDIAAPKDTFSSPLDGFKQALKREQELGDFFAIEYKKANEQFHSSFVNHLNKFVLEQDEEISSVDHIVQRLTLAENGAGLILIDQELGKRIK